MKKILLTVCLLLLLVPCMVNAEEKEKVNVYVFYGDGCPHCHNAFDFFESIEEEYGKYFEVVKYETWYSHQNSKMMLSAAEALNTDTTRLGVPYIIIGNKTFLGYTASYDEEIKQAIVDAYNDEDYEDKVMPVITAMRKGIMNTVLMAGVTCVILLVIVIINLVLRKKYAKNN